MTKSLDFLFPTDLETPLKRFYLGEGGIGGSSLVVTRSYSQDDQQKSRQTPFFFNSWFVPY